MSRPCILHTKQYRSVYEGMVNSLNSFGLCPYMLYELRRLQHNEVCSCGGADRSASESPVACPFLNQLSDTEKLKDYDNSNEKGTNIPCNEVDAPKDALYSVQPRQRPPELEAIVRAAQTELIRLAGMRNHLPTVDPAISRLMSLLNCALAANPPPPPKVKPKPPRKARIRSTRPPWYVSDEESPRRRPRAPCAPYAPLRWPPLAVTIAVLKGQRALPPQPRARHELQQAAGWSVEEDEEEERRHKGVAKGRRRASNLLTDDLLDVVEQFESKLRTSRAFRRGRCGAGVSNSLATLRFGPKALKQEPRTAGGHRHPEALPLMQLEVAKLQRKEQKAVMSRQKGLRDNNPCLRASKETINVAELWPYK
ncbi:hypothetical protein Vafri_9824 [Volvox africanus]|uniref:Uncharacterized protein n=1 Tax=Volvox africanus TaxID=51714 RepID=A0A8J4B6F7_9CHLO|nr:hypothetical protein Vafri_9824 [Volvox africanus]